jgi:hypothetical protein
VIAIYERHQCPAELIVPYHMGSENQLLGSWAETRFRASLWNMDSPWILSIGLSMLLNLIVFAAFALAQHLFHITNLFKEISLILAANLIVLAPLVYASLVVINLKLGYGKRWWHSLLAPTHIGITDSGFKLYFRGRLFYNYPNLSLWSGIYDVDLITDPLYQTPAIQFLYQSGFGRKVIVLPLRGMSSEFDVRLVLQYFAKYVPLENQAQAFIELSKTDFAAIVNEYKAAKAANNSLLTE